MVETMARIILEVSLLGSLLVQPSKLKMETLHYQACLPIHKVIVQVLSISIVRMGQLDKPDISIFYLKRAIST